MESCSEKQLRHESAVADKSWGPAPNLAELLLSPAEEAGGGGGDCRLRPAEAEAGRARGEDGHGVRREAAELDGAVTRSR